MSTSTSGSSVMARAKWEFRDGPLTGRRKKKAEDLPWKEFDVETQRNLDRAYEVRHIYPYYVYKYKFEEDKELTYKIHLMAEDDKMFQTNDYTDVKRLIRRTPLSRKSHHMQGSSGKSRQGQGSSRRRPTGGLFRSCCAEAQILS